MKIRSNYQLKPHRKVQLEKFRTTPPADAPAKPALDAKLIGHRDRLDQLQEIFYASKKKALLIVLQGMDTAGKDGTIRHIFSGVNPQGCNVAQFKTPTPIELLHDFLWRVHAQVPERGMIGIFNRSHYEDVLYPHVHDVIDKKTFHARLDDINEFESTLTDSDVVILKFFLHISFEEQGKRLQARLDDKDKQWKISDADFRERKFWKQYKKAYETLLHKTSHSYAPWFVIPSDDKTFRNAAISEILLDVMQRLKLSYPKPSFDAKLDRI